MINWIKPAKFSLEQISKKLREKDLIENNAKARPTQNIKLPPDLTDIPPVRNLIRSRAQTAPWQRAVWLGCRYGNCLHCQLALFQRWHILSWEEHREEASSLSRSKPKTGFSEYCNLKVITVCKIQISFTNIY